MVDILILVGVVVFCVLQKNSVFILSTVLQVYNILQILSYHQYNNAVSMLSINSNTIRKQTTTTLTLLTYLYYTAVIIPFVPTIVDTTTDFLL